MASLSLEQLIQEAGKLPPIPQAALKALTLLRDPNVNAATLARVIGMDQVLAAHVLRGANSAYYGMKSRIVSVQQAIMVLGLNSIQELIMTYSLSDQLNRPVPGYDLQRGELWQHALGTAIGAKLISKRQRLKIDEEAYFGGLLCDIGKLVFERLLRNTPPDLPEWGHHTFLELERERYGFDHAMLGAEMARRWQLPENLVTAIAHHHEPQAAEEHRTLVATIHVADATMMMMGIGVGLDGLRYELDDGALRHLGLSEESLVFLFDQISEQLARAKELIY